MSYFAALEPCPCIQMIFAHSILPYEGNFPFFYRNTQGNILHFNNSIFHVYSHSVELKLSDILLTEAHTLEAYTGSSITADL